MAFTLRRGAARFLMSAAINGAHTLGRAGRLPAGPTHVTGGGKLKENTHNGPGLTFDLQPVRRAGQLYLVQSPHFLSCWSLKRDASQQKSVAFQPTGTIPADPRQAPPWPPDLRGSRTRWTSASEIPLEIGSPGKDRVLLVIQS